MPQLVSQTSPQNTALTWMREIQNPRFAKSKGSICISLSMVALLFKISGTVDHLTPGNPCSEEIWMNYAEVRRTSVSFLCSVAEQAVTRPITARPGTKNPVVRLPTSSRERTFADICMLFHRSLRRCGSASESRDIAAKRDVVRYRKNELFNRK